MNLLNDKKVGNRTKKLGTGQKSQEPTEELSINNYVKMIR